MSNSTQMIDDKVYNLANILSVAEREYRGCIGCVFWGYKDGCTSPYVKIVIGQRPCQFNLTQEELCQILDPYFME